MESIASDGLGGTFALENALHADAVGMCRDLMEHILSVSPGTIPGNGARQGEYYAGKRHRTIRTLFGDVRSDEREYYYDRKRRTGRYPFDDTLGLINGSTPALVARALRHAVKDPYAEASSDFEACMSRHMSADILMTYPRALEGVAERFMGEALSPDAQTPECVCVLADGTGLPLRRRELRRVKGRCAGGKAKTREAKVGAIFTMRPAPDAPDDRMRDSGSTTYVATIDRKSSFADRLRREFDRRFPAPPGVTMFIADGAAWLWDIRRTHFPFAVEILDFYHAAEHLDPILDLAGFQGAQRKRVFRKWCKWLKLGKVGEIIRVADELVGKTKEGRKAVGYFKKNKGRMKYDEYVAKGWFIGSGVVESACKTVLGKRFKQAGMLWSKKGIKALLQFRIAYMSGRYEDLWKYIIGDHQQVKVA
ncbi:MAG: ISKra4 family transposase [bacterium]